MIRTFFALLLATLLIAAPAQAQDVKVDLELALGVDVSGSVDFEEAKLQRNGYIKAFRHPAILEAIQRGPLGRIAVSYYEWAGYGHMKIIAPWMVIHDQKSAEAFAAKLQEEEPETASRTAIASAITMGAAWFDKNNYTGTRRVIDISGDGPNNWGEMVTAARDRVAAQGITINGLPIVNDRPSFSGRPPMKDLDLYYRDCVIGGPRAFYVVAKNFNDFGRAVIRKLILEIADLQPSKPLLHHAQFTRRKGPPCDIGERRRMWRMMEDEDIWPLIPQTPRN